MVRQTEVHYDVQGAGAYGVHVKLDRSSMPYKVATFDGNVQLSSWKTALQKDDEILFARGVLTGKKGLKPDEW